MVTPIITPSCVVDELDLALAAIIDGAKVVGEYGRLAVGVDVDDDGSIRADVEGTGGVVVESVSRVGVVVGDVVGAFDGMRLRTGARVSTVGEAVVVFLCTTGEGACAAHCTTWEAFVQQPYSSIACMSAPAEYIPNLVRLVHPGTAFGTSESRYAARHPHE
jgi:hypothetical protein